MHFKASSSKAQPNFPCGVKFSFICVNIPGLFFHQHNAGAQQYVCAQWLWLSKRAKGKQRVLQPSGAARTPAWIKIKVSVFCETSK